MNNISLGQKIKTFRIQAKLSQFQLELKIGASPGSVSRIENNLVNPTKETLQSISHALNLNAEQRAELFDIPLFDLNSEYVNLIVEKVLERIAHSQTSSAI